MELKSKKKILIINIFLFALLFGLISFNKEILRPNYGHLPFMDIFTGSFPNFIAALIISLAFINAVLIKKSKNGDIIVYTIAFLIFLILTIEELLPLWGASEHYDNYDIIASGLGSLLALLTYKIIVLKRNKRSDTSIEP